MNTPVWPFITSTRQADILIVVDNSAGDNRVDKPSSFERVSADTFSTCTADNVARDCSGIGETYDGIGNVCCDQCKGKLPTSVDGIKRRDTSGRVYRQALTRCPMFVRLWYGE